MSVCVALYLEGLDDAARLLPIAARARERGVQILALKLRRSKVGQDATPLIPEKSLRPTRSTQLYSSRRE
jgi:hypothetical protein